MRKIEILIDEAKLGAVVEKYPYMAFGERLTNFLRGSLDGSATGAEFEHFRQIGITVALDGFPASSGVSDEDRVMQPLWQAVNTIHAWAEAEPVALKKRWLQLAEEAAMTAIYRVQQGQRGEVLGQWPMDAFLHTVWALAVAMMEVGATADSQWFGQEYASVVEALKVRGLPVNGNED